jgi:hypothetical protein
MSHSTTTTAPPPPSLATIPAAALGEWKPTPALIAAVARLLRGLAAKEQQSQRTGAVKCPPQKSQKLNG